MNTNTQAVFDSAVVSLYPAGDRMVGVKPLDYLDKVQFDRYIGACRSAGAQYNAAMRSQIAAIGGLSTLVASLKDGGFAVQMDPALAEYLHSVLEEIRGEAHHLRGLAGVIDANMKARGLTLWRFQSEGVAWLQSNRAGLLGDDPGLGKTVQAAVAIPPKSPVVIVCPASLKGMWVKALSVWRPDLYPTILEGRNSFRWPLPNEVVILNWDILPATWGEKKHDPFPTGKKGKLQLERDPRPGTVVIGDEAHSAKSTKAIRSRRWRAVCRAVLGLEGYAWPMTGTPILNRPSELWTLLTHIGRADEIFGNWPNFCRLFNFNASTGKWGDPKPEAAVLLRKAMLRRRRRDVLPDLPTKQHVDLDVDLDENALRVCDETLAAMRAAGLDINAALDIAQNQTGFDSISKVRAAIATAMIPHMVEWVEDLETSGEPCIVASAHRGPINLLQQRPGWKVIHGDIPPADRTAIESEFQRGLLKGVGLTIAAGGVGLTLTKANRMLFVDVAWTPALNTQCEDRICRIGQTRGCLIERLTPNHELVHHVYDRLLEKQLIIENSVERAAVQEGEHASATDDAAHAIATTLAGVTAAARPANGLRTAPPTHTAIDIAVDDLPF